MNYIYKFVRNMAVWKVVALMCVLSSPCRSKTHLNSNSLRMHMRHPEHCTCFPKPDTDKLITNILKPEGGEIERFVVYLYKHKSSNKIWSYIPNNVKQTFFPNLSYEGGDVLLNIDNSVLQKLRLNFDHALTQSVLPWKQSLSSNSLTDSLSISDKRQTSKLDLGSIIQQPFDPFSLLDTSYSESSFSKKHLTPKLDLGNIVQTLFDPLSLLDYSLDQSYHPDKYQTLNPDLDNITQPAFDPLSLLDTSISESSLFDKHHTSNFDGGSFDPLSILDTSKANIAHERQKTLPDHGVAVNYNKTLKNPSEYINQEMFNKTNMQQNLLDLLTTKYRPSEYANVERSDNSQRHLLNTNNFIRPSVQSTDKILWNIINSMNEDENLPILHSKKIITEIHNKPLDDHLLHYLLSNIPNPQKYHLIGNLDASTLRSDQMQKDVDNNKITIFLNEMLTNNKEMSKLSLVPVVTKDLSDLNDLSSNSGRNDMLSHLLLLAVNNSRSPNRVSSFCQNCEKRVCKNKNCLYYFEQLKNVISAFDKMKDYHNPNQKSENKIYKIMMRYLIETLVKLNKYIESGDTKTAYNKVTDTLKPLKDNQDMLNLIKSKLEKKSNILDKTSRKSEDQNISKPRLIINLLDKNDDVSADEKDTLVIFPRIINQFVKDTTTPIKDSAGTNRKENIEGEIFPKILGGDAATSSGTPVVSKGRSGYPNK